MAATHTKGAPIGPLGPGPEAAHVAPVPPTPGEMLGPLLLPPLVTGAGTGGATRIIIVIPPLSMLTKYLLGDEAGLVARAYYYGSLHESVGIVSLLLQQRD